MSIKTMEREEVLKRAKGKNWIYRYYANGISRTNGGVLAQYLVHLRRINTVDLKLSSRQFTSLVIM